VFIMRLPVRPVVTHSIRTQQPEPEITDSLSIEMREMTEGFAAVKEFSLMLNTLRSPWGAVPSLPAQILN
jgi:hypothetical protein